MDIAGFSMVSSQVNLMSKVSLAVTKLAVDTAVQNTAGLTKLLEQSVQPQKGTSIDIKL